MADVLIVAAEPSGDALGAKLADSLRRLDADVSLEGIGGEAMAAAGLTSAVSTEGLAILGFVEGLRAYPFVLRKVREVSDHILGRDPRAVVLIDSWGFMVRVAKRLKRKGYRGRVIKYVAPQVWAMRSGRAKVLARHVDHLLSTQVMDAPYFDAVGLPQTYVGNAVFDTDWSAGDGAAFRARHGLGDAPVLGVFLGSRPAEIERIGPAILRTALGVQARLPDVRLAFSIVEPVRDAVERLLDGVEGLRCGPDALLDLFAASDAALACSGTITSQLAAAGVPTVVVYRLQPLTFAIASRLFKPDHISLVNIAAGEALMPEFMQDDIDTSAPADAVVALLQDEKGRETVSRALKEQTKAMTAPSAASDAAAAEVLRLIASP